MDTLTHIAAQGRKLAKPLLAAALLFAGCAQERHYGVGGPPSACRINAVLYCEIDSRPGEGERCRCVPAGRARDLLGVLSRP